MTGRLHPRLLPKTAQRLYAERWRLSVPELEKLARAENPAAVFAPVGAPRVGKSELEKLREDVVEAARRHGFPEKPSDRVAFDQDLSKVLLSSARLLPAEAGTPEVWSFQALVLLPDVSFWRFPPDAGKQPNPQRTIGSDLTRHVFARAWWRAYLLASENPTPDSLSELLGVLGEADLDQIQSRRDAYGGSPKVFQGILEVWAAAEPATLAAQAGLSERDLLRELLKRLRRLGAFVCLDALERDDVKSLLEQELTATTVETREAMSEANPVPEAAKSRVKDL